MKLFQVLDKLDFDNKVEKSLDDISEIAQNHAKSTNSFRYHTSSGLQGNINIIKNGHFARTVLANKDYAYYLEYGNNQKGPYIYPVRAKALHFWINGKEIFAKRVRSHEGYFFMKKAKEFATNKIIDVIKQHFKSIL